MNLNPKSEALNPKQYLNPNSQNSKQNQSFVWCIGISDLEFV
jgi:hypothetical protein